MSLLNRWVVIGAGSLLVASLVPSLIPSDVLLRAQSVPASRVEERARQPRIDFARDIQPIFKQYCAECHGPSKARGRLRLHTPDAIVKGGLSGSPITPGKSEVSLLVRRVMGLDGEDQMPLDGEPLPEATIARLRAWIDQGAPMSGIAGAPAAASGGAGAPTSDPEHWSYSRPTRPALPAVARADWARNAIDRFVLARLEREKLSPSPEATKSTLLRRVTLDLTGLPPSPAELDAFLADTSPDAYDHVVDRLLASRHYGERWARPWLDLARYADTNGYEKDNRRSIWKYRDWVIDALNADMPFDQFTIEQIAGDMLPDATTAQKIATGFHRNAMTNEEGGVDPAESMYEVLVDRVNTTATVWLGTTLACAQCHNHKYDPFSQKDYFRLLSFFANSDFESRTFGDGTRYFEARLDLATPEQEKARRQMQADIDRLEQELKTVTPAVRDAQEQWEQSLRAADRSWTALTPVHATATNGVTLTSLEDGSLLASGPNPPLTSYVIEVETSLQAITGLRLETLPHPSLPRSGPGRDGYGHFRVTGIRADVAPAGTPPSRKRRSSGGPVQDDKSGRFRVPLRAGGHPLDGERIDESQRRVLGDQRHARRGTDASTRGPCRRNTLRLSRRHSHHRPDRSPRRDDRPGHRPLAAVGHDGGRSTRRKRAQRPAAAGARAPAGRAKRRAVRRPGRVLSRDRAVAQTRARRARRRAEGACRPSDSFDAGDEGTAIVREAVLRAAGARKLHGQRRRACTRARPPPSIRCATIFR